MDDMRIPQKQGLYDPQFEHDSCGVGFICNIKGNKSNDIVIKGIQILKRLSHRGAVGADPNTGDGAGIVIQMPHLFFKKAAAVSRINLPEFGAYGAGLVFLPTDREEQEFCEKKAAAVIKQEHQKLLGWRTVPVDDSRIGETAKKTQPMIKQLFIGKGDPLTTSLDFERTLYVIRKQIENIIRASALKQKSFFYITNLSYRTFCYKGLLMPGQLDEYFLDLRDTDMESAIALVHSRYSTNTFPTWELAQPFRFLAHNGEINTIHGNINWMAARESMLQSSLFGEDLKKILPVIVPRGSDSATIDNVFELLVLSGRSLPHAMMMLVPGAWENNELLNEHIRNFYQYHACLMEPWDGPAAISFTDGTYVGAVLDRNGLRPARYIVTKDGFVVMASEVGVLDIEPSAILYSGRLEPGKIFFIDTATGSIIDDKKIKAEVALKKPYTVWIKENLIELESLREHVEQKHINQVDVKKQLKVFGYTREDLKIIIQPMADTGHEPIGSMGNDTPHAVLSRQSPVLYTYFKQLFAQVTNPAIDPIREEIVMSGETLLGPEKNILEETPGHCQKLKVKNPILSNEELEKLRLINVKGFKSKTISILFEPSKEHDIRKILDSICSQAHAAIKEQYTFIILSDCGVDKDHAPMSALLAVGAVHQCLVKNALRTQISIILESGEPREVHHCAALFGYGVDCINPYLAYEAINLLADESELAHAKEKSLVNYRKALEKGITKILSKMGISTLQSYRGAQIFEALGLAEEVVERCFTGTPSRIGGISFDDIEREIIQKHADAYNKQKNNGILPAGGVYQWRKNEEFHLWNPETIALLQDAVRTNDYNTYKKFAEHINDQSENPTTIRSLLQLKKCKPIPLEEVEPVAEIVKRFATGAMSFGSISKGTHETLAIAMNRLGGKSNTGEGGEDPVRFITLPDGDTLRSAIKQVASGRFGVTTHYLVNADELQIKIAQGAKPGEGGQLPGHKVSALIARTRYTTPGVTLISPPPHHDIYSIEDLAQLIFDLKNVNPAARISVKLVSEVGVGTIAAGVAKGHADMILIAGGDGGTGASPLSSIKHAGLPWELGLSETHQTLLLNNLRSRVRLQTDGQLRTGSDVAIAALLGAEEFGFSTAPLITLGCVMLRHCHLNNCSVGVATQDDVLQQCFAGKPEYVINFFTFVAQELREIMAGIGVRRVNELIGRTDFLEINSSIIPLKAKNIDLSRILYKPDVPKSVASYCVATQNHRIADVLDTQLIAYARDTLEKGVPVKHEVAIKNNNRTTGAMLSGEVCKKYGEDGLPENTIHIKFRGTAGQSFGAFLMQGITFELEGMANDYIGKGIFGGIIIVYPDRSADYKPHDNTIIGNTTFYGAVRGEAYIRGIAGERFCIRNSGLRAVVEGVGDHACEYMTGGKVLVLGKTGRNFAAGMSGGIAYVYDPERTFKSKCNLDMVACEKPDSDDIAIIQQMLSRHYTYTASDRAKMMLDNFTREIKCFVKVMPTEYKRIILGVKIKEKPIFVEVGDG